MKPSKNKKTTNPDIKIIPASIRIIAAHELDMKHIPVMITSPPYYSPKYKRSRK